MINIFVNFFAFVHFRPIFWSHHKLIHFSFTCVTVVVKCLSEFTMNNLEPDLLHKVFKNTYLFLRVLGGPLGCLDSIKNDSKLQETFLTTETFRVCTLMRLFSSTAETRSSCFVLHELIVFH